MVGISVEKYYYVNIWLEKFYLNRPYVSDLLVVSSKINVKLKL